MSFYSPVIQHIKNNGNNAIGIDLGAFSKNIAILCYHVYHMANGRFDFKVDNEDAYFHVHSRSEHALFTGKDRYRLHYEFALSDLIYGKISYDGTASLNGIILTTCFDLDKFYSCDLRVWHQATQEAVEHHLMVALLQVSEHA